MFDLKGLTLEGKIIYLKSYIEATKRDIRQLETMRLKYTLEEEICKAQVAESKIEIEETLLKEANAKLDELTRNKRETIVFT